MIETTVSQRRELDSERQRRETQDQRKAREVYHHIYVFETCSDKVLVTDRTLWLDVLPSSLKLLTLYGHFIAPFARNNSKTSLSMMSTPTHMPTTTRHA